MTAITAPASVTAPGTIRHRVLWTLRIVLGVFFLVASGLPKLVGQSDAVRIFHEIGWGDWFRYLTGVVEVSGGLGLLIPRLSGLAAAGLSITMVCAAATQAFVLGAPTMSVFPLALAVLFAWMSHERGLRMSR
ncbi:DoxX family protein [Nocardia sp. NPDC051570]|uniref:DoxX family protein n=1 Tax=Nocardia sp. NPDC051570 TaxID=3364324 RepID=UPI003791316C